MKTSIRFLTFAGAFGLVLGTIYWFVTYEEAGTSLLLLMGVAALIMASFLWARARTPETPQDDPEATPESAAGQTVGHFSTGSIWPLVMAIGIVFGIEGFVYGTWLLVFGLALFVFAAVGLMQESRG